MLVMVLFGAPVPLVLMGWYVVAAPRFVALFADFGAALLAVMASAALLYLPIVQISQSGP